MFINVNAVDLKEIHGKLNQQVFLLCFLELMVEYNMVEYNIMVKHLTCPLLFYPNR